MKTNLLKRLLFAAVLGLAVTSVRADWEDDTIAILQSNASVPDKCNACKSLRIRGTAKSIPALIGLMNDERTAHAARYALEGMPLPEAVTALRKAMVAAQGSTKAGLIDSLGWRHDSEAVALIAPLLSDSDAMVASASAGALGRIGDSKSVAALTAAQDKASAAVQPAVLDALLNAAATLAAHGNAKPAIKIYQGLFSTKYPDRIRIAAWQGLATADVGGRVALITGAFTGKDYPLEVAAQKTVRQLNDPKVAKACLKNWSSLSSRSQVAVLDANVKLGTDGFPAVHAALQSSYLPARVAALQALADINDASFVPDLVKAAAAADAAEREAARDTLNRVFGAPIQNAMLDLVAKGKPEEKAILLRAFGERGDASTANVLVQNVASDSEPVRLAALESLRMIASPKTVTPLLDLAGKVKSEADAEPIVNALSAICQAGRDKEQISRSVLEGFGRLPAEQRSWMLDVLADLGTPAALEAAQAATKEQNAETVKQAIRVLSKWPNAGPAPRLLELAGNGASANVQVLALRGCITVVAQEPDFAKRFSILKQAMSVAKLSNEKRQALSQIALIPTTEALQYALTFLTDSDLANEAGLASLAIAEKISDKEPKLASETAVKVLSYCKSPDFLKRAFALRGKFESGPFVRDWFICGPYRQPNTVAAKIFDLPFGPEDPAAAVEWKSAPQADVTDIQALYPNQVDCVVYLKATIVVPEDTSAAMLIGSDDGVKAWLNGIVVHANNVGRALVIDQDVVPVQLKKGKNALMLKIIQDVTSWGACARFVGIDGKPIPGLTVENAGVKDAALPEHDAYKKVVLSDKFYAEGATYGDINKDGKLDVIAGPFWFEGPDFQKRHEYRPAQTFDPHGYSDNFLTYVGDFNGDGWPDILCVPFPGADGFWYENPAGKEGPWKKHLASTGIGNESPVWGDVNGDGRPELIFCKDGYLGYAGPDTAKPDEPWVFHPISTKESRFHQFTHGVGIGDINGDKLMDIVEATGWWEQPAEVKPGQTWTFHPYKFAEAGAQMLVYDVDGDGLADVITAYHCHLYGMVWNQQVKDANGKIDFKQHVILSPTPDLTSSDFRVTQMHAMELVDMNGDGIKDILTGKRYWAHGPNGDKETAAPAVVFWMELHRDGGNVSFIPHLIDDDSGVGTQVTATDLNGDGRPDVIVANKKGIFVHLSQPK